MSAAWWRKPRGPRSGGRKAGDRALAAFVAAPTGLLHRVVGVYGDLFELASEERAALEADVRLRLAANDYAALRELHDATSLTALLVLVERLAVAHCQLLWVRWREEAAGAGHGDTAAALERLVYEEALSGEEALAVVAGDDGAQLAAATELWSRRPWRGATRPIVDLKWSRLDTGQQLPREPTDLERQLSAALQSLSADDRLILSHRFAGGVPPAALAPLQRSSSVDVSQRVDDLLDRLRGELAKAGVEVADLAATLADPRPGYRGRAPTTDG